MKKESNKSDLQVVEIQGTAIPYEWVNGKLMVNATKMAQPFGKSKGPQKWLRTSETQDYIKVATDALKCPTADLLVVRQGGIPQNQGTWIDDSLIILFARFISPDFAFAMDQ
ncbi:MAG: KilA-N domain-containing protein [Bacteroidales bacterium]